MGEAHTELLRPFGPDKEALTEMFQRHVDDGMLWEIARADYGYRAEEMFPLLVQLRDKGGAASGEFQLSEVLELSRYGHLASGDRGRWIQLFASVQLLRPAQFNKDPQFVMPYLVYAAVALGDEVARRAASMLAAFTPADDDVQNAPETYWLGLLLLAVHLRLRPASWLAAVAKQTERMISRCGPLGARYFYSVSSSQAEIQLARQVLLAPPQAHPEEAREMIELIGGWLAAGD
jgi:hypothetical protein